MLQKQIVVYCSVAHKVLLSKLLEIVIRAVTCQIDLVYSSPEPLQKFWLELNIICIKAK